MVFLRHEISIILEIRLSLQEIHMCQYVQRENFIFANMPEIFCYALCILRDKSQAITDVFIKTTDYYDDDDNSDKHFIHDFLSAGSASVAIFRHSKREWKKTGNKFFISVNCSSIGKSTFISRTFNQREKWIYRPSFKVMCQMTFAGCERQV